VTSQPTASDVTDSGATAEIVVTTQPMSSDTLLRPRSLVPSDCGRWCIMKYCDQLYPGAIRAVENNTVLVRALHPIGINKFTNPRYVDELWHDHDEFLGFIEKPAKPSVRSRFVQVKNSDQYQTMLDA